jgi:hypothetical protein
MTRKVYFAYQAMKARCYYPWHPSYSYYGGRGITVCDRWLEDIQHFAADIGNPPTTSHSLDRIDNNGNYEPSNCRWATKSEQQYNTRRECRDVAELKPSYYRTQVQKANDGEVVRMKYRRLSEKRSTR